MSDYPARVSLSFHLGGPGTMTADKQFSIYVSRTLDCLGKNEDMIKYRVKMWREWQAHFNIMMRPMECIIAGSKAEGLTSCYESDIDSMLVFPDVICADNVGPFIHNTTSTVFQTDRYDLHAGYTKLKLVKFQGALSIGRVIQCSLLDNESENKYLSSNLFLTKIEQLFLEDKDRGHFNLYERSGPSLPLSHIEGYDNHDRVFAFRCVCNTLLQSFMTRQRPYNRPSRKELGDISVMDAHVVPVGHKGSNNSHNEWRICFTKAEIYLIQILNESETKLYIILKMVSKLLKFISKDITSYVMKNIVLWLVELYSVDLFTEELLAYQLIKALKFLQKCVEANYLPSYMIPERNLLAEQLNPLQKLELTTFLSTLIHERGYLLLRCEKLRYGMTILYREPDMAEEFRKRRDMVERLSFLLCTIGYEKWSTTGLSKEEVMRLMDTDGTTDKIISPLLNILFPDFVFLLWQGYSYDTLEKIMKDRYIQMLS